MVDCSDVSFLEVFLYCTVIFYVFIGNVWLWIWYNKTVLDVNGWLSLSYLIYLNPNKWLFMLFIRCDCTFIISLCQMSRERKIISWKYLLHDIQWLWQPGCRVSFTVVLRKQATLYIFWKLLPISFNGCTYNCNPPLKQSVQEMMLSSPQQLAHSLIASPRTRQLYEQKIIPGRDEKQDIIEHSLLWIIGPLSGYH